MNRGLWWLFLTELLLSMHLDIKWYVQSIICKNSRDIVMEYLTIVM